MKQLLTSGVILFTILCLIKMVWWLYVSTQFDSFQESKAAYLAVFPDFLTSGHLILIVLLLTGFNIGVTMYYTDKRKQLLLYVPLLIINSSIFTLNLWSVL